jgi:hypothetical protein
MIDVKHKRCQYDNCNKQPAFNLQTETKGIYCFDHKLENMIAVKSKRCKYDNCIKIPSFNLPTETKALYCFEHKLENMINVVDKKCIFENCIKIPSFNLPTETKGIYCSEHKLENMINVKNKNCQYIKCKEQALFGLINKRPQYCKEHKHDNMINLILENKCSVLDGDDEYNEILDNIKYCNKHIPENKLEIVKRLCKYCDIKENIDYVCKDCKKIQNKKEWAIVRYLRKVIDTKFEYNSSKMLQGCSKKRPDIYFDLHKHCIIVEIDENQHIDYDCSCENKRIMELSQDLGHRPIVFIRFNPDNYDNKGNCVSSCWGQNANGICVVKKNKKSEWLERLNALSLQIDYWRELSNKTIEVIQLFYDS